MKRLLVEFRELMDHPTEGLLAGPIHEDNFMEVCALPCELSRLLFLTRVSVVGACLQWECFVAGPPDTPFEGGVFCAVINFPSDYPLSPVR